MSSAVATILLLILVIPIVFFQNAQARRDEQGDEAMPRWTRFNVASVVLGFAFLYLPIVLLVIFSFNESKLVTVWGGFSTKWYASLFRNQALLDAAWVTLRVGLLSATVATVLGTPGGAHAGALHALPGPHAVFRAWSMRRWSCPR